MHTQFLNRQLLFATLLCGCLSASAELGIHWWPAGNAAWSPRYNHDVVEFQGALYCIGGVKFGGVTDEEGAFGYPTGETWKSEDGLTWTKSTNLTLNANKTRAVASDTIIRVNQPFNYWFSEDGIEWNYVLGRPAAWGYWAEFDDKIWSVSSTAPPLRIHYSPDGHVFTPVEPIPADIAWYLYAVIAFQDKLIAFSSSSKENWISDDGITWSRLPDSVHAYENLLIKDAVVLRERVWLLRAGSVFWSDNAIDWFRPTKTEPLFPPRWDFACVAWNERIWVYGGYKAQAPSYEQSFLNDIWYSEDTPEDIHRADYEGADGVLELSELLRVIQLYQMGKYHCDGLTEDTYAPGEGYETCFPHSSDYNPQDWQIDLNELLRAIQFYNTGGYSYCPDSGTEDGFCPGGPGL